jgi:hypothetical protein
MVCMVASDRIALWTAIATTAVFIVYIVIAIFTIIMAKAAARSASISTEAFKEGQKYQEQTAKHQELSSFLDLFNLLLSKHLSPEVRNLQFKVIGIMKGSTEWFNEVKEKNMAGLEPITIYRDDFKQEDASAIIDLFQYLDTMSHLIRNSFPRLTDNDKIAVMEIYAESARVFFPFYNNNDMAIFGEFGGVADSNFGWLYKTAPEVLYPHPEG